MQATLFSDGGARGNPGPAGIGYVITRQNEEDVAVGKYIGETTNNQAEYQALLAGLSRARDIGIKRLMCFLDSELVVRQIGGVYRVRDADLLPLYEEVCELVSEFEKVEFTHVPREKNKKADKLVNEAIDKALDK